MILCRGCKSKQVEELLDIGKHPISNHFLKCSLVEELHYPLVVGQCSICGIAQLKYL